MKRVLLIFTIVFFSSSLVWAQENILTITGGPAWINPEEMDENGSGYRINGTYEFNPNEGMLSHGISFGYIGTNIDSSGVQGASYKLNTWPVYYQPRLMFGKGKAKAFVKGALGMHFSGYKRTGVGLEVTVNDSGFYGGASVGAMIDLKDNIFIVGEYEWAYMSNSFYGNGFMNSANFGIGFKF